MASAARRRRRSTRGRARGCFGESDGL